MTADLNSTANALADALKNNTRTDQIDPALLANKEAIYQLQETALASLDEPISGWKIGATNAKAQAMLGASEPFYGPIPKRCVAEDGGGFQLPPGAGGVEIEIAFKLAKNLPNRNAPYSESEIRAAIASMHPAIEIIGTRQNLEKAATADLITADFGGNAAFVPGNAFENWDQIAAEDITAQCVINGEVKTEGQATIVLGSPILSLAWLADHGPGLRAGDWISTGTITGLVPISPGDHIKGSFSQERSVELQLTSV